MGFRLFAILLALLVICVGWVATCVIWRAAEVGELVQPLEPRSFERLTLVTVGSGGPYENPERRGPATAVGFGETLVLVDAGRGVASGLRLAAIPVSQPRRVLLTHLLPVNTQGLDDLVFTGWLSGRDEQLQVIGPPGTAALVDGLVAAYRSGSVALGRSLGLPAAGGAIEAVEIGDGWQADWGGLSVRAASLAGGPTPAVAYRFEAGRRSAVVSGTGWGAPDLEELARGADALVHEAVYIPAPEELEDAGVIADPDRLRREAEIHTALLEVGGLAARAGVRSLVLVRLRPPPFFEIQVTNIVSKSFGGRIWVPEDGDEIEP